MFDGKTVADAMHTGLTTCAADASAAEVARAMSHGRIHCVIVADGDGRRPWAVVSDLDLMRGLVGDGEALAASLAATKVVMVAPTTPLGEAARLMAEHQAGHLVVVHPATAHPIGVISTLDVARAVA
jgi:CBS domain-containing protein